jgi:hypothetical protein
LIRGVPDEIVAPDDLIVDVRLDDRTRAKGLSMINEANTGFMLLAASLVMLMTPGLAFF